MQLKLICQDIKVITRYQKNTENNLSVTLFQIPIIKLIITTKKNHQKMVFIYWFRHLNNRGVSM